MSCDHPPSNLLGLAAEVRQKHSRVTQMVSNLDWKQLDVRSNPVSRQDPSSFLYFGDNSPGKKSCPPGEASCCAAKKLSSTAPLPWASSLRSFATLTGSSIPIFSSPSWDRQHVDDKNGNIVITHCHCESRPRALSGNCARSNTGLHSP